MTCGFLIQLVLCHKKKKTWWFIDAEVKHETRLENTLNAVLKNGRLALNSAVSFDMYSQQLTLPSQKPTKAPSSWYSLLKFIYVTSQLSHSLAVHPLLRKILDPPLHLLPAYSSMTLNSSDHYTILGNCPPTPPLSQYFSLTEK